MYGALDISTGGMVVARIRAEVATANLAAATNETVRDADGNLSPFKRRTALVAVGDPKASNPFARESGVHVAEIMVDDTPPQPRRYDPSHPDAYPSGPLKGYVAEVNINPIVEQIAAMEAQRAYEANAAAAEATKQMLGIALRIIA